MNEAKLGEKLRDIEGAGPNPAVIMAAKYLESENEAEMGQLASYLAEKTGQGNPSYVENIVSTLEEVGYVETNGETVCRTDNY